MYGSYTATELVENSSLAMWLADMYKWGGRFYGKDRRQFLLSSQCSALFGFQISDDNVFVLGIPENSQSALLFTKWNKGTILKNHKNGNYLCLSSSNVASDGHDRYPFKVFFPIDDMKMKLFDILPKMSMLKLVKMKSSGRDIVMGTKGIDIQLDYHGF